ncbi:MAG: type I restriction enzyme HsdR N-terminal domain-containing protein [Bacteroidetes bacterium]|nr:type I restriction enzyme HsdR N-terminal domain-containing protein [Bacteroidota bacterium]
MKDPVRRKQVADTPEERVRQAVLTMLMDHLGIPASLMAVEKGIRVQDMVRRPDIVVHDRQGKPWMVVECKAPGVRLSQDTMDQAAGYNRRLGAPYLFVTNGTDHRCAHIQEEGIVFLETLPSFPAT